LLTADCWIAYTALALIDDAHMCMVMTTTIADAVSVANEQILSMLMLLHMQARAVLVHFSNDHTTTAAAELVVGSAP
jgi:hypothetical protein